MRNIANPTLACRFCTNDCMLYYWHLHDMIISDTMFPIALSQHGTNVLKYSVSITNGHVPSMWRWKVMHTTPYPSCFDMRVSVPSWLWTALRNIHSATSTRNLEMPAAKRKKKTTDWQNIAKCKVKELKKGASQEFLPTCPANFRTTVWNKSLFTFTCGPGYFQARQGSIRNHYL